MKTNVSKKISSLVLALAVMFTTVFAAGVPVQAATVKGIEKKEVTVKGALEYLVNETGSASAGVAVTHSFDLPASAAGTVAFAIVVPELVGFKFTVTQSGQTVIDEYISATDQYWEMEQGVYANIFTYDNVPAGSYDVSLTFDSATEYAFQVAADAVEATMSQEKATITKGFTKKLSVSNGKVSKWSSSKKSVATVDSKGKVTAKKTGKATITATLEDGSKVTCKITVKDNKYTDRKITTSDVSYNAYGMNAYSASFDKKGNLVVKISIVNGGYGRITKIPGFKVTVKNQNGKKVGSYSKSSFKVNVGSYSQKTYTITIKKSSKMSAKKVDLRNSVITVDGGTATGYY